MDFPYTLSVLDERVSRTYLARSKCTNRRMNPESEIIRDEIPDIEKIVHDECWLEGERRGCAVDRHETVIRQRVADVILNGAGEALRRRYTSSGQ